MGFAIFALTFFVEVAVINHLVFVGRHWQVGGEQIVPLLRLALFRGAGIRGVPLTQDIHHHLGIVFLPPFLDIRFVEPCLVC